MKANFINGTRLVFIIIAIFLLCGFSYSPKYKLIPAKVLTKIKIPKWYHEGIYFDGKEIWVNNGKKGNTWVVDTANGKIIREIKPVAAFTEAITPKDKGVFFATDWGTEKVYTVHIENDKMAVLSEKSVAPAHPAGALWNGSGLFVITWTRSLTGTKFHLLKMDGDLNILSTTEIKKILEPAHLAWDGRNTWISCWYSRRVYKVDIESLEILGYFKSPAAKTTGIAWDGKHFWVTGTYSDLYKMEVQN